MNDVIQNFVVPKPWGYEYLLFENDSVGIWFLHINHNEKTSLHCHPTKKTGLIVLDGEAEISFLNNKNTLRPTNKTMIWQGVFHSTKALSLNGIELLEVESPKNKGDLVRIKDMYGRQNVGYEESSTWIPRDNKHLWIKNTINESVNYKNKKLSVEVLTDELLNSASDSDIIVVLENDAIVTSANIPVCKIGDVLTCNTLKYLKEQFYMNNRCIILYIKNETI